ncbi:hypothetical protein [Enterobacter ludwigii]|uniref:hypothetical protein n=1 Tax=Enterobacter ludwigii TaxID=299767 RepID=UPI0006437DFA|nr:hypothetical protein [Enterobacter ludwigii]KLP46335.1 hypothetical protein ABR36_01535 [Enterobacter ludwigii]
MNTANYVGPVANQGNCTLYRPVPLVSDAPYIAVNHDNLQAAEQRRQHYQNALSQYPLPEPDKGACINASLFEVSLVELSTEELTSFPGVMLLCMPSLVVQVLASNGILGAETTHIDSISESHINTQTIATIAPLALQRSLDGCLYFDILMQECLSLGLSELHARMAEYENLWGRTDQLEILALVVFYALAADEDFLLRLLNQNLSDDSLRIWWCSKPELHQEIDDYIFFAFFDQWQSYC